MSFNSLFKRCDQCGEESSHTTEIKCCVWLIGRRRRCCSWLLHFSETLRHKSNSISIQKIDMEMRIKHKKSTKKTCCYSWLLALLLFLLPWLLHNNMTWSSVGGNMTLRWLLNLLCRSKEHMWVSCQWTQRQTGTISMELVKDLVKECEAATSKSKQANAFLGLALVVLPKQENLRLMWSLYWLIFNLIISVQLVQNTLCLAKLIDYTLGRTESLGHNLIWSLKVGFIFRVI